MYIVFNSILLTNNSKAADEKIACGFALLINCRSFHTPSKSKIARTSYQR